MPDATPDAAPVPPDDVGPPASPDASTGESLDASAGSASKRAAAAEASVGRLLARRGAARPARRVAALARLRSTDADADPDISDGYLIRARHLDAVVDAGLRHVRDADLDAARACARRGDRLLAAVRRSNGRRWVTDAAADVAALALASGRLGRLHRLTGRRGGSRPVRSVRRELTADLRSRLTDGVSGSDPLRHDDPQRDATGAAGAIALHLARLGDLDAARRVLDGAWAELLDVDNAVRVGDRPGGEAEAPWPAVRVADRGAALGALVTVGDPRSLERAALLVAAVDAHLARPVGGRRVLAPAGDGGAFGVLARYLALAAETDQLDASTREVAARLVRDTADALWAGRDDGLATGAIGRGGRGGRYRGRTRGLRFSPDPGRPAAEALGAGPLSPEPQLQAWTVLEAAARLA